MTRRHLLRALLAAPAAPAIARVLPAAAPLPTSGVAIARAAGYSRHWIVNNTRNFPERPGLTASELIDLAAQQLGLLLPGERMTAVEQAQGLALLNGLLGEFEAPPVGLGTCLPWEWARWLRNALAIELAPFHAVCVGTGWTREMARQWEAAGRGGQQRPPVLRFHPDAFALVWPAVKGA
jgi:hypothetical protein